MRTKELKVKTFTPKEVAHVCDHTFLKRTEVYNSEAGIGESPVRIREKEFYQFLESSCQSTLKPNAVCIRAEDVPHAFRFFQRNSKLTLPIVATVGFPEGHWYNLKYKIFEAQYAMSEGASEIDMVINYQALKEGNHSLVLQEVQSITRAVHGQGGKIKLILETSELTNPQIVQACHIATHVGADFVKTSTGYGAFGVQLEQLEIICKNFQGGIKVSGGITAENIHHYLSVINNVRGGTLELLPEKFRIGESQLLQQLGASQSKDTK